jgi:membrane-associated phospholipid phosphatase
MYRLSLAQERVLLFMIVSAFWVLVYFGVGNVNAARHAWTLAWDPVGRLPLLSPFVVLYLSVYAMPLAPFFVLRDREKTRKFALMTASVIVLCGAIFLMLPLTIERPLIVSASLSDRVLAWLYATDRPINLFPSMHVALAYVFACVVGQERPRWNMLMMVWATMIAISTLFTRQHYVVDVLGGIVVAAVAWRFFLKMTK